MAVVVSAFNEEANIARLIGQVIDEPWASVLHLDKIIVIDDGSEDGTLAIVRGLAHVHKEVQVIHHLQRLGKNAGLREAIASCTSDITVILDADIRWPRGSLTKTVRFLVDDPSLAAASCINDPLPARVWRERASRFQAVLISELRYLGQASLLRLSAIRTSAIATLDLPDAVADDLYIMRWLTSHGYSYAVCTNAAIHFRSAIGLRDFAKQTLRAWRAIKDLDRILPAPSISTPHKVAVLAVGQAIRKDPVGFLLYVMWRGIIMATPAKLWMPTVALSSHNVSMSTKDLGP